MASFRLLFILGFAFSFSACTESEERSFVCLGDSHVYRWDLGHHFPLHNAETFALEGGLIEDVYMLLPDVDFAKSKTKKAFIHVGVNDVLLAVRRGRGIPNAVQDIYTAYSELADTLQVLGDSLDVRFFILEIMPPAAFYDAPGANQICSAVNELLATQVASLDRLAFVTTNDVLTDEAAWLRDDVTTDGLHLNQSGYIFLSGKIRNHVQD